MPKQQKPTAQPKRKSAKRATPSAAIPSEAIVIVADLPGEQPRTTRSIAAWVGPAEYGEAVGDAVRSDPWLHGHVDAESVLVLDADGHTRRHVERCRAQAAELLTAGEPGPQAPTWRRVACRAAEVAETAEYRLAAKRLLEGVSEARERESAHWKRQLDEVRERQSAHWKRQIDEARERDAERTMRVLLASPSPVLPRAERRGLVPAAANKLTAPANAPMYTVAAMREMTGLENKALNQYAKKARVTTPKRGGRNYKYPLADARAILETIIAESAEDELRDRCKTALRNLPEIAE